MSGTTNPGTGQPARGPDGSGPGVAGRDQAPRKLPRRPAPKPSGLAKSVRGDGETPASGSDGPGKDGGKRRKGRGPRRRNPDLHRREVRIPLECAPEGSEHRGWQAHTVRDIVFHAGEVTWLREVRRFPDGTRHVAPLSPGVARGRGQYGPGVRAPAIMLYRQCQPRRGRITALPTTSAWTSPRAGPCGFSPTTPGRSPTNSGRFRRPAWRRGGGSMSTTPAPPPPGSERVLHGGRQRCLHAFPVDRPAKPPHLSRPSPRRRGSPHRQRRGAWLDAAHEAAREGAVAAHLPPASALCRRGRMARPSGGTRDRPHEREAGPVGGRHGGRGPGHGRRGGAHRRDRGHGRRRRPVQRW